MLVAPTVTLPQNLLLSPGTLYEDFEMVGDWAGGQASANTSQSKTGTQSIKLTSAVGGNGDTNKTINWDLSGFQGRMRLWIYLHNTTLSDYGNSVRIRLSNDAGYANYFLATFGTPYMRVPGWNLIDIGKGDFSVGAGSPSWSSPIVRIRMIITATATKTVEVSFDSLYFNVLGIPVVLLRFDDGSTYQYSNAFQYMKNYGVRGTLYMVGNRIDTGGNLSATQLREMDVAGWVIGNHTHTHASLTSLTEAQQEAELANGEADLATIGLSHYAKYVAYPGGLYNADTYTALAATGMLTGQNAQSGYTAGAMPNLPSNDLYSIPALTAIPMVAADCIAQVDQALANGTVRSLAFHDIGGAGDMSAADFHSVIDYLVSKRGQIYPITIDDYYRLTLGPVEVPV